MNANTRVYTVGFSYGPYLPNPDSLTVCATINDARAVLADELDRAADAVWDSELSDAQETYSSEDQYNANFSEAHEGSASISGSAELVKNDRDGDVTYSVQNHGGWFTNEPDGYTYWITPSTLGDAFGDDTSSDEYLDVIDALESHTATLTPAASVATPAASQTRAR